MAEGSEESAAKSDPDSSHSHLVPDFRWAAIFTSA